MLLVKKCNDFHDWFSLKIRLEIRFNNIMNRKQKPFFDYKNKINHSLKNRIFPRGLTHAFGRKMQFLFLFVFGPKKYTNQV